MKLRCLLPALGFLPLSLAAQEWNPARKLAIYQNILPVEKVFVHTDRTLYDPNESLWFSAYVVNGDNRPSSISNLLQLELLDQKGSIVQQKKMMIERGKAWGSLQLGNMPGGIYRLRAYTNYMANFGDTNFFSKDITIQKAYYPELLITLDLDKKSYAKGDTVKADITLKDLENKVISGHEITARLMYDGMPVKTGKPVTDEEGRVKIYMVLPDSLPESDASFQVSVGYRGSNESMTRPVNMPLKGISVQFMPEGGHWLAGIPANIAFKALNRQGKGADISGEILDREGKVVAIFRSQHTGMGIFSLTPAAGESYAARITSPYQSKELILLPKVEDKGYSLLSSLKGKDLDLNLGIRLMEDKKGTVIVRQGNRIIRIWNFTWDKDNTLADKLRLDDIKPGILCVTLFNQGGIPVAERLLYTDADPVSAKLETDKETYNLKGRVKAGLKLKDASGNTVKGNYSLSVVDARSLNLADDRQDMISSYLLVGSELQGTIEEPSFYFTDGKDPGHGKLDLVMLTHGWRRINWRDLMSEDSAIWASRFIYDPEVFAIKGTVLDVDRKAVKNARVFMESPRVTTRTDSLGNFVLTPLSPYYGKPIYARKSIFWGTNTVYHWSFHNNRVYQSKAATARHGGNVPELPLKGKAPEPEKVKVSLQESTGVNSTTNEISVTPQRSLMSPTFENSKQLSTVYFVDGVRIVGTFNLQDIVNYVPVYGYNPNFAYYPYNNGAPLEIVFQNNYNSRYGYNYYYKDYTSFYSPAYLQKNKSGDRSDKRKTLFWAPDMKAAADTFFYTNDEATSFVCMAQGITEQGVPFSATCTLSNRAAVDMKVKFPAYLVYGDTAKLKILVYNHLDKELSGKVFLLSSHYPHSGPTNDSSALVTIPASGYAQVLLPVIANAKGHQNIQVTFDSDEDYIRQYTGVKVIPSLFIREATISGAGAQHTYTWDIKDALPGTLTAKLTANSSVMDQVITSSKGMIREPHGCFEQVSSTNYPNIVMLELLESTGQVNKNQEAAYVDILKKGYARLSAYETTEGGFSWYGGAYGNEGLTAYGLVQFNLMRKWISVDEKMLRRTMNWLRSRKNPDGSYMTNQGRHGYAGSPTLTTTAYITWALSEMQYQEEDLETSISWIRQQLEKYPDDYVLALLANIYTNTGEKEKALRLIKQCKEKYNGNWTSVRPKNSITYSGGIALHVETVALLVIAGLKAGYDMNELRTMTALLLSSRDANNRFGGSTQSTALALQAIARYASKQKLVSSPSASFTYKLNAQAEQTVGYNKSELASVSREISASLFNTGTNSFTINFANKEDMVPYLFNVRWESRLPGNPEKVESIRLSTSYASNMAVAGQTIRLNVKVENVRKTGIPQTIAVLGIPAGCGIDPVQLRHLKENKVFDYYEIYDEYLVLYWAELPPESATLVGIDLKAEVPGFFESPPSSAYLYYTPESKYWSRPDPIIIKP